MWNRSPAIRPDAAVELKTLFGGRDGTAPIDGVEPLEGLAAVAGASAAGTGELRRQQHAA